jgi:hypothetical protein
MPTKTGLSNVSGAIRCFGQESSMDPVCHHHQQSNASRVVEVISPSNAEEGSRSQTTPALTTSFYQFGHRGLVPMRDMNKKTPFHMKRLWHGQPVRSVT